jgi:hypothetical protein
MKRNDGQDLDNDSSQTKPRALSSAPQADATMRLLNPYDVLHGRGSLVNRYQGNIYFRDLIRKRKEEYSATTNRHMKDLIARQIVAAVAAKGGRFLHKEDTSDPNSAWSVVDNEVAVEKAKQALRDQEHKAQKASIAKIPKSAAASSTRDTKPSAETEIPRQDLPFSSTRSLSHFTASSGVASLDRTQGADMPVHRNLPSLDARLLPVGNLNDVTSSATNLADLEYRRLLLEAVIEREREAQRQSIQIQYALHQLRQQQQQQQQQQESSRIDPRAPYNFYNPNNATRGATTGLHPYLLSSRNILGTTAPSPFASLYLPDANTNYAIPNHPHLARMRDTSFMDRYSMHNSGATNRLSTMINQHRNLSLIDSLYGIPSLESKQEDLSIHHSSGVLENKSSDTPPAQPNEGKEDDTSSTSRSR